MKKLIRYFKLFLRRDFQTGLYIPILLFLACAIFFNYRLNFYSVYIRGELGDWMRIVRTFLFFTSAYLLILVWVGIYRGKIKNWKSRAGWGWMLFALCILSFDLAFYWYHSWVSEIESNHLRYYVGRLISRGRSTIIVLLPIMMVAYVWGKDEQRHMGLLPKRVDWKLYFSMLLFMIPLITLASFSPSFLKQYPSIRPNMAHELLELPQWATTLFYELVYGLGFVSTELFFRGLLIIGLMRYFGRDILLPMVVVYVFIHFNKPMGEAISSAFGGYILGILAFYTRNIWGGIIVHLGVAWGMEIAAFIQHTR